MPLFFIFVAFCLLTLASAVLVAAVLWWAGWCLATGRANLHVLFVAIAGAAGSAVATLLWWSVSGKLLGGIGPGKLEMGYAAWGIIGFGCSAGAAVVVSEFIRAGRPGRGGRSRAGRNGDGPEDYEPPANDW